MKKYQFSENKEINQMLNGVVSKINSFAQKQIMHINRLTRIGSALSTESELQNILHLILEGAIYFTNADGATIYTVSTDKKFLDFQIVYNRSLNIRYGGKWGKVSWDSLPLYDNNGEKILNSLVSYVFHTKEPQIIDDVYEQAIFDNSGTIKVDKMNNYRSKSMLAIPLKNHENEILGIIQLINSMTHYNQVQSFNEEHRAMLNSLASQAAISLTNKNLIEGLEELLHQFVRVIAYALDKKSKYSGMHISRVALLTEMFTDVINQTKEGLFSKITFSDEQVEEISVSGWLHDLGKIITPEYIMDKSTKLETIYDKIEIIKLRFDLAQSIIANKLQILTLEKDKKEIEDLNKRSSLLDSYLSFVQSCNVGGEFMVDDKLALLKDVYDFRLNHNGREYFLINDDEYSQLGIRKGTLSQDERKAMEDHAVTTKELLEQLSFPKKFKNVPLYASSHHEKLNGKGYPSHLSAEQLPIPARIIATADIFEALTAADRPYKEGKKLSEAFMIMKFMVKDNEIDANLFNLLLESGLYKEYADKFLKEEQIDEIDINNYLVK